MRIEEDIKLDYADVLFRPKRSTLSSRKEVNLNRTFTFKHSGRVWEGVPIMAANMDGVGTIEMAVSLHTHGMFTCLTKNISIENYSKDVLAFITAMNLEKVILVGHSMGGGIVQQIALDYPKVTHGIILIATGAKLTVNQSIIDGIITKPQEIHTSSKGHDGRPAICHWGDPWV